MAKKAAKKAKKSSPKKAKPAAKKPAKKAKAPANKKAARKPAKPLKKKPLTSVKKDKVSKSPIAAKAAKPVKKPAQIKNPVKPSVPVIKNNNVPAKNPVPVKVPAPVAEKATPKSKVKVPVVLDPNIANLPKLPKGFHLKKQKGKLAPGEKRVLKTEVITHHVIHDIPLEELARQKPEPKGKYSLEYIIRTPVSLLYDFLTTPNGLAEWFADGVDMKNDVYEFTWDGAKQKAEIVSAKLDNYLRLRWLDKPEGSYFEFRMSQDEMTGEVSLVVTDFGENEEDIATGKRLWASQIQRLIKALGTY